MSFLIGAALGATAVLLTPSPRENALQDRVSDLEADLAAAQREASDSDRVASRERERTEAAEEEARRLRQALASPRPVPAEDAGMGHAADGAGAPARDDRIAPKDWDDSRLRMEIERLAGSGRRMGSSRRLGDCVEAARAQGDSALGLLIQIMGEPQLPHGYRRAATLILERLGDERAAHILLEAWEGTTEFEEQHMLLRALANLPGAKQIPVFVTVWTGRDHDERLRLIAVHGLARRGHSMALRAIRGEADGVQPAVRARAIESLHAFVIEGDYAEASFITDFGQALLSADGEGQQRLALLALEGYWRAECVAPLRAFAALDGAPTELRERASGWADAIEEGAPRPERAGQPKARTATDADADADGERDAGKRDE